MTPDPSAGDPPDPGTPGDSRWSVSAESLLPDPVSGPFGVSGRLHSRLPYLLSFPIPFSVVSLVSLSLMSHRVIGDRRSKGDSFSLGTRGVLSVRVEYTSSSRLPRSHLTPQVPLREEPEGGVLTLTVYRVTPQTWMGDRDGPVWRVSRQSVPGWPVPTTPSGQGHTVASGSLDVASDLVRRLPGPDVMQVDRKRRRRPTRGKEERVRRRAGQGADRLGGTVRLRRVLFGVRCPCPSTSRRVYGIDSLPLRLEIFTGAVGPFRVVHFTSTIPPSSPFPS